MNKAENLKRLSACRVVAVIRLNSTEGLIETAEALLAGGVIGIELTMTTPGALKGIEALAKHVGDRGVIGVGTVLDPATARDAMSGGAEFVVSPAFDASVHEAVASAGKLSMPGAYTPTEILKAWNAGADVVKVFPSSSLGPSYFKDVLSALPFLKLMPTGGVDATNAGTWVKAGAVCVGAGSNLVSRELVEKKDWEGITKRARAFVTSVM